MNALFMTDGYKLTHHQQYPTNTSLVYSNFTPRSNKYAPNGAKEVVSFGLQAVMRWLHEEYEKTFFSQDKETVCGELAMEFSMYANMPYSVDHFRHLHDLGYLPIRVKAVPEGTLVPMKVPVFTIRNTRKEFYWITNYLETILSNMLWQPMTSATIALEYRRILTRWAKKTDETNLGGVGFAAHDFSMRGMGGISGSIFSAMGHAAVFNGSDVLPVIPALRKFYNATGFIVGGVPATEHSVMCAGGKEDEIETFRRLLETFPTGILSIVSDTWDLWKVITHHLPALRQEILDRPGKLVIRPDSGDPVQIICGQDKKDWTRSIKDIPKQKGVIELLWDIFGGTFNAQGYKVLDPHIGAIYGDSITVDRAEEICKRLEGKGFASTNIVLGVGSFTYQYNTRDTFGFAMKATYVEKTYDTGENKIVEGFPIFKDPITDDGTKKSATGLLRVDEIEGKLTLTDNVSWEEECGGILETVYLDGEFLNQVTLEDVRTRILKTIL